MEEGDKEMEAGKKKGLITAMKGQGKKIRNLVRSISKGGKKGEGSHQREEGDEGVHQQQAGRTESSEAPPPLLKSNLEADFQHLDRVNEVKNFKVALEEMLEDQEYRIWCLSSGLQKTGENLDNALKALDVLDGGRQKKPDDDKKALDEVTEDKNVMDYIVLTNQSGASAKVCLYGGQVVSWTTVKGEELLSTGSMTNLKAPTSVRGGINICFPQFGDCTSPEDHGFVSNRMWIIDENPPRAAEGEDCIDLLFKPSGEDLSIWPHSFEFRLRVALDSNGALTIRSRLRNIDSKPFSFSIAYHAYLSMSDIRKVRVERLKQLCYIDNMRGRARFTEEADALTFGDEVDRVYLGSGSVFIVGDRERGEVFCIGKEGLPDVVVRYLWGLPDDEEYKRRLCVGGAAIEKPISLEQGKEWKGTLRLYFSGNYSELTTDTGSGTN